MLSPSGDFAFGFRQLQNQTDLLFSLSVWYANDGQPVIRGSKLNLTADTGLLLTGPRDEQLWKPSESVSGVISNGVMSDDGNFELQALYCKLADRNPNKAYYASKTTADQSNSSSAGVQLVFNQSGAIYVLRENDERSILKQAEPVSMRDYYFRLTLDYDGMLTQYAHPKNSTANSTWTPFGLYDDICREASVDSGLGVCGYNSICTLKEDKRPTCSCPKGYSPLDRIDIYGDCQPDFPQGCAEDELTSTPAKDLYDVVVLINTDWPSSDYTMLKPLQQKSAMKLAFKIACVLLPFSETEHAGRRSYLSQMEERPVLTRRLLIKVRKGNFTPQLPPFPFPNKKKDQDTVIRVGAVLLGSSEAPKYSHSQTPNEFELLYLPTTRRGHGRVQRSTGKGSFGIVYKGVLRIGESGVAVSVAVKKLNCVVEDSEREFKNEVNVIGQTHHKNLSQTYTAIRGTKGYVASEWFRNMPITAKVDVYSFGVVLLEIICCRRSVDVENVSGEEKGILTDWAFDCYQGGALDVLMNSDEVLENRTKLEAFVMVALWCIQENPCLRPTMRKVVHMLEGVVEVPVPPCPSPYSTTTITIPSQKIN
ncbi:hypothetical protein FNV43_RR09872 [Rhamnella rubrinervis]|uniref:Bulb-type lectin domain-containing protein n=1 Tax=Rhamnella rubrinervis TaxID=2594499 RepID=A0A8K0HC30_9ROSA|nr:hypothetical protein FNV43_RR09872 [Rhamnella rubrinervis]